MTRFVPRGEPSIPLSRVRYSNLNQDLKDRITKADPSELELLEWIVITAKKINIHLMVGSDEEVTEDDINWP